METLSTKVPPSMKERIEEYADSIGETRSTAIRELLRDGLNQNESPGGVTFTYSAAVSLLGMFLITGSFIRISETGGMFGIALVTIAFGARAFRWYTGEEPLKPLFPGTKE